MVKSEPFKKTKAQVCPNPSCPIQHSFSQPGSRSARRSTRPPAFLSTQTPLADLPFPLFPSPLLGASPTSIGTWAGEAQEAQQQQEGDEEEELELELLVSKNGGLHLKASALDEEEAKVLDAEARVARLDEGNILEAESSLREGLSLNYEDEMRAGESNGERNGNQRMRIDKLNRAKRIETDLSRSFF